jgi:hypothetical protein
MAIKITKPVATGYKYIPTSERGEKEPFAIWVKPLSTRDLMVLEDNVVRRESETVFLSAGQLSFKVLQKSLVSWENITDADGNAITVRRNADGTASEESLGYLGAEMITEIANVVAAISRNTANIQIFFPEDEVVETKPTKKVKEVTE